MGSNVHMHVFEIVHIEVLETLTTSSLINALRRFFAFRGPAKILRSDQGTNFVGAANELKLIAENKDVKQLLQTRNCTWILNPPKAPHMGGTWERMIGVAKKILNSILSKQQRLTHEVLSTVLCEAMEIINSRPLVEVSTDPDSPTVLSPATLKLSTNVLRCQGSLETGAKSCKHVRRKMETRVSDIVNISNKVATGKTKHPGRRRRLVGR